MLTQDSQSANLTATSAIPQIPDVSQSEPDAQPENPLEHLAARLSHEYILAEPRASKPLLLNLLAEHKKHLTAAYQKFSQSAQEDTPMSYAAEWLLDNFFVVQQTIRQVTEDMPPGYYQQLPKLKNTRWSPYPRVYALAQEIIAGSHAQIDISQIIHFLHVFQRQTSLTMGEIWAFPTMLRLGILSSLAHAFADVIDDPSPSEMPTNPPNVDSQLVQSCIISLRMLAIQDWKVFFESVSHVEEILHQDPANVYTIMDFDTRNRYRKVIEQISRASKGDEEEIAQHVITLSQAATPSSRQAHIGYYLIGDGRRQLNEEFDDHVPRSLVLREWLLSHPTSSYLISIGLLTGLILVLSLYHVSYIGGNLLQGVAVGLLTILPITAITTGLINWVVTNNLAPRLLPRLDFREGIPSEYKTMVVIPTLLIHDDDIESLLDQLEQHFLRNSDPSLFFALLTDYADASQQHMPNDDTLIQRAQAGIAALNATYPQESARFYLFHRERQWNAAEGSWMGWERKRGKLMEFNHVLRGDQRTSYLAQTNDLSVLADIKYVITLDTDTILPEGGAKRLVATLAHPLNRAEYDSNTGKVISGYSILQPHIEIKPVSVSQSRFTQIFAGEVGLDLYTHASSDVYQDLFGVGSYVGKGIYDVDILELCLANRIPENSLLSHDLFEGIHARVALVSDIFLLEDYPAGYLAHTRRLHRWIRGDWQLLPWLLPRIPTGEAGKTLPNTFSIVDRWKIFDNLRRSLVAPALLASLVAAWLGLVGSPLFWTLMALAVLAFPLSMSLFSGLYYRPKRETVKTVLQSRRPDVVRFILALVFLPHEALVNLSAITITLVRLFITRRQLLQWTTAAQTARFFSAARGAQIVWREMLVIPTLASLFGIVLLVANPTVLPLALPILILWGVSPQIAHWISLPNTRSEPLLSDDQEITLRHLARQTWLFFEQVVGPQDHWLPPDHFQDAPRLTAHRTSPTNIGLLLTSTLAAYDLGYIGQLDLSTRLQATFESLDKLEHYQGHLLNWYDTLTLTALSPRYVSTVDSGNLAGCLIVVEQACLELPNALAIRPQRWQGLLDTLGLLEESLEGLYQQRPDIPIEHLRTYVTSLRQTIQVILEAPEQWSALITWLNDEAWTTLSSLIIAVLELDLSALNPEMINGLRITSERFHHHLTTIRRDIDWLLPWLMSLNQAPALFIQTERDASIATAWQHVLAAIPPSPRLCDIAAIYDAVVPHLRILRSQLQTGGGSPSQIHDAQAWCTQLEEKLQATRARVQSLLDGYQRLAAQAETHFQAMDFSFLFNRQRKVFHIGYNLASDRLDDNFYDLLASEARLVSLLAIAKREVTPSHWMHLGRPITQVNNTPVLLSWSGTMFEYLMPTLFMESYEQTFLTQSCEVAVDHQIAYGRKKNVPWGISESSYYAFDSGMTYQYHAFGVPDLGLKRGLMDDLVIAPYASLLALNIRPQAVRENMHRLDEIQMRGLYGFYESVDYTLSRLPLRQNHAVIRSYMAHHQGMILTSLTNYLDHNIMIQRFHADPRIKSFALLLQEKIPTHAPIEAPHPDEVALHSIAQAQITIASWHVPNETTVPQVHVLSNGRYSTLITNAGSGYSQWQGLGLTRWEADTTLDASGSWIYVQDQDSGAVWSAGQQPKGATADQQQVSFHSHQAEFQRRDHDVTLNMQVTVAPDDDVEIRHITLINHCPETRHLRLTSYAEVLLAAQGERHAAFSKLFIESEYLPENNMLLFHRRPRSADEVPVYLGHVLIAPQGEPTTGAYDTDRMPFVGRGRSSRHPAALQKGQALSQTVGITLDPIMALGQDIELKPYGRTQLSFLTLVAASRQKAAALADRYRSQSLLDQAIEIARRQNEIALRQLELGTPELSLMQQILSLLLYPQASLRASADILIANTKGQSSLWAYAISGDLPILLVRIGDVAELPLVLELLHAHAYWHSQQVMIDLVILNLRDSSYSQELQTQLQRLITRSNSSQWLNQRGGVFVINADQMGQEASTLLQTAARVVLDGAKGPIAGQLPYLSAKRVPLPVFNPPFSNLDILEATPPLPRPTDLQFDNGYGGFSPDGKDYVIYLEAGQSTPAPWVNVIANETFGFLVSESGAGYTWSENSSENRLTPWRNDPVTDSPGEALYLRDEETGHIWSPMPLPTRDSEPYLIRHGAGYSSFGHHSQGLKQQTLLFAAKDDPVKIIKLHLQNTWDRPRRVTITYYAEWVLGVSRSVSQPYILSEYDHSSSALLARNAYNTEFSERVAFLAASKSLHGLTADRTEFLGRMGDVSHPAALARIGLTSTVEPGLDPCAALQLHIGLPIGGSEEVFFLLGQGANRDEAMRLIHKYQEPAHIERELRAVHTFWDETLGTVNAYTPDPAMNIMLNRWLLYQALVCRIWGRTGFYQSSGAFGFRDQLQDVMALLLAKPGLARKHILEAARHQFEEGDVLHWWHPPFGRGVRTRFSDDLLWLPYVVAHYVETTGDTAILDEKIPFLRGAPLKPEEEERYGQYDTSTETASLYEHCLRAIKRGSTKGVHGLPLMGTGDWNDGMNRVGMHGRGESVWVGWFLSSVLTKFTPLCKQRGDSTQAEMYHQQAEQLKTALETEAWDGAWYRRAYYDNGTPLGSAQNLECQIDAIAQSWAVLSGAGEPVHVEQAMSAVAEKLVHSEDQLILLFTPPFDKTPNDPGYIKGYPPGIRENGGQYTHAAIWTIWAFAQLGQGDRAGDLFKLLNPIFHSATPDDAQKYRVEPYVIAADVYSVAPYNGRGGWTWYTGSASWMYRLGIEALLGLQRQGDHLIINPCIPADWEGYEMTYRDGDAFYNIHVHNPQKVNRGVTRITLDDHILEGGIIPLVPNRGHHEVHVELGRDNPDGPVPPGDRADHVDSVPDNTPD